MKRFIWMCKLCNYGIKLLFIFLCSGFASLFADEVYIRLESLGKIDIQHNPELDGIYEETGSFNGKKYYKHQSKEYYIFWDTGNDYGQNASEQHTGGYYQWDLSDKLGGNEIIYSSSGQLIGDWSADMDEEGSDEYRSRTGSVKQGPDNSIILQAMGKIDVYHDPGLDGIYEEKGSFNDKKYYKHRSENYYIFWDTGRDYGDSENDQHSGGHYQWDLSDELGGNEIIYSSSDHLLGDWSTYKSIGRTGIVEKVPELSLRNLNLFGIGTSYFGTSEELEYFESFVSYRNRRRDMDWPYQEADSLDLDWGLDAVVRNGSSFSSDFNALQFDAFIGKRLQTGSYLEVGVGVHGIRGDDLIKDDTIPIYWAKGLFPVTPSFDIEVVASFDYLYPEGFQPGSLIEALTSHTIFGELSWKPVYSLWIKSQSELKFISDSNKRFWTDLAVLYGISPDWPWVWVGAGANYLTYEFESDNYWSPSQYISYGPRLESSFPINEKLTAWAEIHLNVVTENEIFEELGDDISLGIDWALTKKVHMLLGIERFDSIRDGDHYYENSVFLSFHLPLP